jgi:hypothetical protein
VGLVGAVLLATSPGRSQEADPPVGGPNGRPANPGFVSELPPEGSGSLAGLFQCNTCWEGSPGGLFGTAEYLLVKPRRRALDFAIVDPIDNGIPEGPIEALDWKTRSGLRLGAGYQLPGESWDAGLFYTYLHSNDNRALVAPPGGTLYATLARPNLIEQVSSASGATSLDYDVLDVEIGRRLSVGDAFWVRLSGGGRLAWIDQSVNVLYDGLDADRARVRSLISFDGAGLRLGGEGHWTVGAGLSLFGRAHGSLLVGDFRSRLHETDNGGATLISNVSDKFRQLVPVTELGVGIAWQGRHLRVSLGYELVNWFNLVDGPDFVDDVHNGKAARRLSDLSLEAVVFQVGITF